MEIEAPANYLDRLPEEMPDDDDMIVQSKSGFLSGSDLVSMRTPKKTKTHYYISEADQRDNLETIADYFDPVGYSVYYSETRSFWFGTTNDAEVVCTDLSLLKLLSQGREMAKISGDHEYELMVLGNNSLSQRMKSALKKAANK